MLKMKRKVVVNHKFLMSELADDKRLIEWLMSMGLIAKEYVCGKCGNKSKLVPRQDIIDGYEWRCCNFSESIRKGSWFKESKLSMRNLLRVTYLWCLDAGNRIIIHEIGLSKGTLIDFKSSCRQVCVEMCARDKQMIGGVGKIVEIGECKYQGGDRLDGKWVFVGVERRTNNCFVSVTSERGVDVLLDILEQKITPGTTVISNCWKADDCFEDVAFQRFKADSSIEFKNPERGVGTSALAGTWAAITRKFGSNDCADQFESCLFEYIWKRRNKQDLVGNFLAAVKDIYPPKTQD